jgi:hypothetical protein
MSADLLDTDVEIDDFLATMRSGLVDWFNADLDEQIELGNDQFVLLVDGSVVPSRASFATVDKRLRADFLLASADMAVSLFRQIMQRHIVGFVKDNRRRICTSRSNASSTVSRTNWLTDLPCPAAIALTTA